MKIALCQMNTIWEDKEMNQIKAARFVEEASQESVELLLFPELCLTGFSMNIQRISDKNKETIEFFSHLAKQYNIHIGFGWAKASRDNIKAQNHFTVVTPSGETLSDYIKIHPFSYAQEEEYFQGGEDIIKVQLNEFMLSTFICYDLRFPEVFQAVSNQCQMIIIAANWPEKRRDHWNCLLKARAIENQVYIVGVNAVGVINGMNYSGDSQVIDPLGNVLTELSNQEGLIICEIENDVEKYRQDFPMKKDRKVEVYKKISSS